MERTMDYYYRVYELLIQSEFFLPHTPSLSRELFQGLAATAPVSIRRGVVSEQGLTNPSRTGVCYQAADQEFWLHVPSVGRFKVLSGHEIVIEPYAGVDEDSVRVFLLNVCFPALLSQRHVLVVSGYAVKIAEQGVAFLGGASSGYFLLLGEFLRRGYPVVGGHFFALSRACLTVEWDKPSTSAWRFLPGPAQVELAPQVVSYVGFSPQDLKKTRPGVNQYVMPLENQLGLASFPLDAFYFLSVSSQPELVISSRPAEQTAEGLQQHLNNEGMNAVSDIERVRGDLVNLANTTRSMTLYLPSTGLKLKQLVDSIEQNVAQRGHRYAHS